ncbi:MAG: hypothetical protein ACOC9H_01100 [Gemmatimonadota bacterium]
MRRTGKAPRIRSALTPPRGAKYTGETVNYGGEQKHVYRELKPLHQRSRVTAVKDPDTGRPVMHPAPPGAAAIPQRQRTEPLGPEHEEAWREFILVDLGNGTVKKVYNFREDAEKLAERRRAAERAAKREALLDRLVDADPESLAAVLGEDAVAAAEMAAKAVSKDRPKRPEDRFEIRPRPDAVAYFDIYDVETDERINEKALRKDDAEQLLESFKRPPPIEPEPAPDDGGEDDD